MNFLNCNYPEKCKIAKGKPKCLKSHMLQLKYNGFSLIEQKRGVIWFVENSYYWGIELDIKYNRLNSLKKFETVGAVNIALLDWNGETLNNGDEDLLYKYLKLIS